MKTTILRTCSVIALIFAAGLTHALAEANYVYHERSTADPGCGGSYVTTLNPNSAQSYTLRFKVEFQNFINTARVYYTTDGSTPGGAFGSGNVGALVVPASFVCTFGGPVVDVWTATIPAQPAGTVVKYIVSAWHTGGGAEIFGNGPGAPCSCGTPTSSSTLASVHTYTVAAGAGGGTTLPILYYDFENNTTRSTFENLVEQALNAGSGPVTRAGGSTSFGTVGGAGTFNGGGTAGTAGTGNTWSSATTDPGAAATDYLQFVVNAGNSTTLSVSFDNQASATGPARVGVLYSTDGSTYNVATTGPQLTGNAAFSWLSFSLPAGANNASTLTIRVYAYAGSAGDRTGRSAFGSGGTFRIDNLTVSAGTIGLPGGSLLNYTNLGLSVRSGTALSPYYTDLIADGAVSLNSELRLTGTVTASYYLQLNGYPLRGTSVLQGGSLLILSNRPSTGVVGAQTWGNSSGIQWKVSDATGTQGGTPGWDNVSIGGSLNITAGSGAPVLVYINTQVPNTSGLGLMGNFDNTQDYTWPMATASGGITGFSANKFSFPPNFISNPLGTGLFVADQVGNSVVVKFIHSPTVTCPGNITQNTDPGVCTSSVAWMTSATGTAPVSGVVCKVSGGALPVNTPVTSPYNFPKGLTMVACTATNLYGTNACSFNVTVNDNEKPVFNCGQTETVSCMAGWGFTFPTITDNCDGLISSTAMTISTTTNFTCGYTFVATRIWQVTDSSANTTYCTQVFNYVDFIPPTITFCPGNITVECLAAVPAPNPALVTATHQSDPCDLSVPLVVHFSDVTNGTGPSYIITRTYKAYDACSNAAMCMQTITVNDTTVPSLTACPASFSLLATGPSGAVATYTDPTATDCDPAAPVVTCNPPSGSTFPIATTTVTCSATDAAGNPGSCQFTITVTNAPVTGLQAQINAANPGDTVVVAAGTYAGVTINKNLTLDCSGGGVVVTGASPALTVTMGVVNIVGGTYTTATDDPTVLVTGGALSLRGTLVEESTGFNQVGIVVSGTGTLDLGTGGDPGLNTIKISMAGSLLSNDTATAISALGNVWKQDGSALASNGAIEDEIYHALDNAAKGLVRFTAANLYVTANSGSIQRGIDAATAGETVFVAAGTYTENVSANKAITLSGANAGQAGCMARLAESTIAGGLGTALTVAADDVTVDGFEMTGVTGISSLGRIGVALRNNKVTAIAVGINAGTLATTATKNFAIEDNCIALAGQLAGPTTPTIGVFLSAVSGAQAPVVSGNEVSGGFYGYLLYDLQAAGPTVVTGGTITGVKQGVAVININPVTFAAFKASAFGVSGVAMSGFTGNHPSVAGNFHAGVYVFSGGADPAATVTGTLSGLTVDGTGKISADSAGVSLADFSTGVGARQNITVQECVIQNNLNRGINVRGSNAVASVTRSTLTGNGSDPIGTDGNEGFGLVARNNSTVTATECFIVNPAAQAGFTVRAIAADASTAPEGPTLTVSNCSIDNNGNASGYLAQQSAGTLNASGNWWGGNSAATIAAGVIGIVDFTPFLDVGTDTAGTAGFQGSVGTVHVTTLGAQTGAGGRIQEGIDLAGTTVKINSGTYAETPSTAAKAITLAPGASPGQVVLNGDLTLDANDMLAFELNGLVAGTDYDQLVVNGMVTLGGATLTLSATFTYADCAMLTLIDNDGMDAVSGTFNGLANGATVVIGGQSFKILYNGGDGNDVVLFKDIAAPVFTVCPGNTNICSPGGGPVAVSFTVTATDSCGATVACTSASGSMFALGTTPVSCTAVDPAGNVSAPCSFNVVVTDTSAAVTMVYVDDGYAGLPACTQVNWPYTGGGSHVIGYDAFATIQAAITAVPSGGTVNVAAGSYAENVNLAKRVNLLGAQNGVDARGRVTGVPSPAVESIIGPAAAGLALLDLNTGCAQSVIDGFVFSGGGGAGTVGAIRSSSGPIDGVQLLNNHLAGFSDAAIWFNRGGIDITLFRNVMDGSGMTAGSQIVFLNGPQTFAGLQLVCNWIQNGGSRAGLFVDGTRNWNPSVNRAPLILQNLFANSTNSVGINMGSRSFDSGVIAMNTFTNNGFDGLQGGPKDSLIVSNFFVDNKRWGLALTSFGNLTVGRGATNNIVTCNTFIGNGFGTGSQTNNNGAILFSSAQPANNAASHQFSYNHISGNSTGVVFTGTETLNMENNWWGSATGPTHASNPGGTGNIVFGSTIDFVPFLTQDTSFPNLTCPASFMVTAASGQCSATATFAATATSGCCGGTVMAVCVPPSGSLFPVGTNSVSCAVTNDCGKSASCGFTVVVKDADAPMLSCSTNRVVECAGLAGTPVTFVVTANDLCDPNAVLVCSKNSGDLFTLGVTPVNCTATDASGNISMCSFNVTVQDTTPPSITCLPLPGVQCLADVPAPNFGGGIVSDVCDSMVTVTHVGDATNGTCPTIITRTWRAADDSGNTNDCAQVIIVQDTTPPGITCPATVVVQCFGNVPVPDTGTVVATDNCGSVIKSHLGDAYATNGCIITVTRTYRATDTCGNTNDCAQAITVQDTTPPSITCPTNVTVQCFGDIPVADTASVTATDNCIVLTKTHEGDSYVTNGCVIVVTRTYKAADACTNIATCIQTITVADTTPPGITCPTNVTVQCFSDIPAVDLGPVIATDNCGSVTKTHEGDSYATNGCVIIVTRTYKAVDACTNMATCTQTITVSDTTPPMAVCSTNRFVTTTNLAGETVTFAVSATDNCTASPAVVCVPVSGSLFPPGNTTVTCTATDACGNTNACVFVVNVNRVPVAVNNSMVTVENTTNIVANGKLIYNDSDPDDDPLTVISVSATSTNGGAVTLGGSSITYTPQPGFTGADRFSYTISDGRGGVATAEVEVLVVSGALPSLNQVLLQPVPGGFRVRFAGIPGYIYRLQRSPDLMTWGTITTITAPAHGIMEYTDTTLLPMAFYRTLSP